MKTLPSSGDICLTLGAGYLYLDGAGGGGRRLIMAFKRTAGGGRGGERVVAAGGAASSFYCETYHRGGLCGNHPCHKIHGSKACLTL